MMTNPSQIDRATDIRDDHDLGPAHAGHLMMATVVCGSGAALAVVLADGTIVQAMLAYLLGGWSGVALAVLAILWYDRTA